MWQYSYNLQGLYQTPVLPGKDNGLGSGAAEAAKIIDKVRNSGRTILTEVESKRLLGAYGIPTVPTEVATTAEEAVELAEKFGYPVVLKLYSETITHKTDVGGVQLNLGDPQAVQDAFTKIQSAVTEKAGAQHFQGVAVQPMVRLDGYELIIGSSLDSQFGPVLLFGTGGQLVEVFKDSALALPPLNTTLARRMMEETRIYKALQGVRGRPPVDIAALEMLMVQFSYLVVEQPWIKEIDINPLLASAERLVALDARVVLHGPEVTEDKLPKLAIRPYPSQYVAPFTMKDGTTAIIRPIRPEDEPLMVKLHSMLSERSVMMRYTHQIALSERVAHERLVRICFNDYDRELALVAEHADPYSGEPEIMAVGRMTRIPGTDDAQFAILVADPFQRHGLGAELVHRLMRVAKEEKIQRLKVEFLFDNSVTRRMCEKLGFRLEKIPGEGVVKAEIAVS
jgi:acetyltransferase